MNGSFTAFRGVTLLSMETPEVQPDQTVLLRDGMVLKVGHVDHVAIPDAAAIVEGDGRYLMPGLSDMHVHLFLAGEVGDDIPDRLGEEERLELLGYLAIGVTTVREMSGSPGRLLARDAPGVIGPRMVVCSPILEGEKAVWPASPRILTPADARTLVIELSDAGYDFIKIYHTLTGSVYREVLATAAKEKIRVTGHVPFEIGIDEALAAGQFCIEHLRGYDFDGLTPAQLDADGGRSPWRLDSWTRMNPKRRKELAANTAAEGVWNVPTLIVQRFLADAAYRDVAASQPQVCQLPPHCRESLSGSVFDKLYAPLAKQAMMEAYPAQLAFLAELHRAGANLLIGSDTPVGFLSPGFTALDEMREFARCGIPNFDILKMATIEVQRILTGSARAGMVLPGNAVDLILLDADPLRDLRNLWLLQGVYVDGVWRSKAELLGEIGRLREAADRAAVGRPTPRRGIGCACCH